MLKLVKYLGPILAWIASEHIKDYRENKTILYNAAVKTNTQINQIILTVSVASLTAIAVLNKEVFVPYGVLSFTAVTLFIFVILFSVINLYFTGIAINGIQHQLNENWKSLSSLNKNVNDPRFKKIRITFNALIFGGFCLGLVTLLVLLGLYILGIV